MTIPAGGDDLVASRRGSDLLGAGSIWTKWDQSPVFSPLAACVCISRVLGTGTDPATPEIKVIF